MMQNDDRFRVAPPDNIRIGKRGVYLVANDAKTTTFRLVSWDEIMNRLSPQGREGTPSPGVTEVQKNVTYIK